MDEKELKAQVEGIAEGVKGFKDKAETIEKTVGETAEAVKKTAEDVKSLSDWKVKKDEADQKNQEALNELLAKKNEKVGAEQKKSVNTLIGEGIKANYDNIKSLKKGQTVGFDLDLKAVGDMTFSASFPTADVSITQLRPGILPIVNRKVHMRQLLPIGTLGKSDFAFVREVAGEGNPTTIAEGATKPQFDIDFEEASVPAEYIAGWLRISRKMLDDVESLTSFLQMRLMEKYLKVEDTQILTGNGTAPNLSGLITNAAASTSTSTKKYDQLLDALAQLEGTDYGATGILLNPVDYYKIAESKASGSGEYDQPGIVVFVNGQLYFDGVPVYKTTAITSGTFLVGDYQMGAQLLIRENPRVEFFEQDSTNVRENKITVRVEGRVALPIYYPDAFVTGTLAAY